MPPDEWETAAEYLALLLARRNGYATWDQRDRIAETVGLDSDRIDKLLRHPTGEDIYSRRAIVDAYTLSEGESRK